MSNHFGKNLKYLRNKKGLEQLELARLLGRKSSSSISEWEKGTYTPKSGILSDIAKIFNVSLSELMNTDLTSDIPSNIMEISQEVKPIPILGRIACGDPLFVEENISEYKVEPANELPAGELFFLRATGDSMSPTIPNESLVLIRYQNDVENGEIAAVLLNGDEEATLKRVKKQDGMVILLPDNNAYDPMFVTKDNPARIIGKALEIRTLL